MRLRESFHQSERVQGDYDADDGCDDSVGHNCTWSRATVGRKIRWPIGREGGRDASSQYEYCDVQVHIQGQGGEVDG